MKTGIVQNETMIDGSRQSKNLITITICSDEAYLFEIPTWQSSKLACLQEGDILFAVARDERIAWLNAIRQIPTGQSIVGWIPMEDVKNIMCHEQEIAAINLPISSFEWYSRDQVNDILRQRQAASIAFKHRARELSEKFNWLTENSSSYTGSGCWKGISSVILGFLSGLMLLLPFEITGESLAGILIFVGIVVVFALSIKRLFSAIILFSNRKERRNAYNTRVLSLQTDINTCVSSANAIATETIRLKRIIQDKKPEQERAMEQQIKAAAISTALNVGAGVVTRLVPDRKQVTHSQKKTKK